nr:hypothetical protein [Desulfobacula sp.]
MNQCPGICPASAGDDPTLFPKHLPLSCRMARLSFDPVSRPRPGRETLAAPDEDESLPSLQEYRTRMEKEYLKRLLNTVQGDREKAGRISGMSQSRLYGLLNKYGLPGFGPL